MPEVDIIKINTLIRRLAKGDSRAIDEIYLAIGGRMLSVAIGVVKNKQLAEEVVSDSFVKLLRHASKFKDGNGYAFICKIVKNTALNMLKSEKLRSCEDIDEFYNLSQTVDEIGNTDISIFVKNAMNSLDELERKLIYNKYFLDYTIRESAESLKISKSTAQRMIIVAEEKLKEKLKDNT